MKHIMSMVAPMIEHINWVKSLKPGDKVSTRYPDRKPKPVTIMYVKKSANFNSGYMVRLEEVGWKLDSFWIRPIDLDQE